MLKIRFAVQHCSSTSQLHGADTPALAADAGAIFTLPGEGTETICQF
jgi:hypothetical protein